MAMIIERFEDIEAWQLGRELTKRIYALAREGWFSRDYGFMDQIQDVFSVHRSGFLVAEIPICFQL